MTILNFLTQDELDDLSEDPRTAFMELVNHAQRNLSRQASVIDTSDQHGWNELEDLRHSFMNVVVAAARKLEIEPFFSMAVPTHKSFSHDDYKQFKADVDNYVTQIMLDNSIRSRRDSVAILPASKDQVRSYLYRLRECVEQANMETAKREALLNKLTVFEEELEKRRTSILAVAKLAFEILAIPGGVWASGDIAYKLVTNVMQVVAEDKKTEDETRQLPPPVAMKELIPPRPVRKAIAAVDELDDDIPF